MVNLINAYLKAFSKLTIQQLFLFYVIPRYQSYLLKSQDDEYVIMLFKTWSQLYDLLKKTKNSYGSFKFFAKIPSIF